MSYPLTVEQLRDHVQSSLPDSALQTLIDGTEDVINNRAGAPGARVELFAGGGRFLALSRPISVLTSVTETVHTTVTTMQADDVFFQFDSYLIERLNTGTNPRWRWNGRVTVTYTPTVDTSLRELVQIKLIESILNYQPGVTSETIGTWSQSFANNAAWNHEEEWESILCLLDTSPGMVVVGSR